MDVARKQHMNTDIKKAVFQAIVSAEDYVQAFENLTGIDGVVHDLPKGFVMKARI